MNTSDILNTAADLIERDGWATGIEGMNIGGAHCAEGAIQAVMGAVREEKRSYHYLAAAPCPAGDAVRNYLGLATHKRLYEWNDVQQDASPVIEVLRACALVEAARERDTAAVS